MNIPKPDNKEKVKKPVIEPLKLKDESPRLKFNDKDSILDLGTNKSTTVDAPKDIPRLEKIVKENMARRKAEEAEEDDDDDDDYDKLTIHGGDSIKLKIDDLGSLDNKIKLNEPKLDVEVLS